MDDRLNIMIMCYLATIGGALRLMVESGIRLPDNEAEWMAMAPQSRTLNHGFQYQKNGFGCLVEAAGPDADTISVMFGPGGETCGFTFESLMAFAGNKLDDYYHFNGADEAMHTFQAAIESGALQHLGNGLYCMINEATGEREDHAVDLRDSSTVDLDL